jgi:hypothetical protein
MLTPCPTGGPTGIAGGDEVAAQLPPPVLVRLPRGGVPARLLDQLGLAGLEALALGLQGGPLPVAGGQPVGRLRTERGHVRPSDLPDLDTLAGLGDG